VQLPDGTLVGIELVRPSNVAVRDGQVTEQASTQGAQYAIVLVLAAPEG